MHNAYDFQDGLSDYAVEEKQPVKAAGPVYGSRYNEVLSELEENISEQRENINITPNAKPQKMQPQKAELKLVLPVEAQKKVEEERNNPNKKEKKIKIQSVPAQEVKLAVRNSIVHISNLEDEDQGVIVLETNYNYRQATQSYKINSLIHEEEIEREAIEKNADGISNDNSFLEVKEEKIQEMPLFKRTLIIQDETVPDPNAKILPNPPQPAPLHKVQSKNEFPIKLKIDKPFVKKGMLFENHNDSDYYMPESASKTSLDTGIQIPSQMSSRDQLSSRNILSQSSLFKDKGSSRKKLPALKPYKEVMKETQKKDDFSILEGANKQQDREKLFANFRFGKFAIASEEIVNVFEFIKKPIPSGRILQCKLLRNKSCGKMFFLDYDLVTASDEKYLLTTKKMPLRLNSTYNLSLRTGYYEENSEYYLGKAKGNFSGSIFNIEGQMPHSREKETTATIYYSSECFGLEVKAREIEIYIKNEDYRYHQLDGAEHDKTKNLKDLYEIGSNKEMKKIRKLINKKPKWNPVTEVYSMNFHGKSRMGSVKNMIIIDEERPNDYLLLLAKQGSNEFAMDIAYPFSPLVALGLMISGFDFKLASQ